MSKKPTTPETISDEALDDVNGGARTTSFTQPGDVAGFTAPGDVAGVKGAVKPGDGSVKGVVQTSGGNGI